MKQFLVKQRFTFGGEKFDIKIILDNCPIKLKEVFRNSRNDLLSPMTKVLKFVRLRKSIFFPASIYYWHGWWSFFLFTKEIDIFKDRYTVENLGLLLEGNIWDLDFRLRTPDGQLVAEISKELFHLTSHYSVTVVDNDYADLVISLVVAIDYVEMMEVASSS